MQRAAATAYLDKMAIAMELLGEPTHESDEFRSAAQGMSDFSQETLTAWLDQDQSPPEAFSPQVQASLLRFSRQGTAAELEERHLRIPPGLFLLMQLPSLTPPLIRRLWIEGQIISIRQLERACHREKLVKLPGFGRTKQNQLMLEIKRLRHTRSHWLRRTALETAAEREEQLAIVKGVIRFSRAGELRRNLETISEIVWVVAADSPQQVLGRIATMAGAILPTPHTPDAVTFELVDRPKERMVVVDEAAFAAMLFLETGTPAHTDAVLSRLSVAEDACELPVSEAHIYQRSGLPVIAPELREGRGEIESAETGQLPELITAEQIRGVLHVHTNWSDGKGSVFQMAQRASELGWQYMGVSDHSEAAFYAHGLSPERIDQQREAIVWAQESLPNLKIFRGIETDILPDGSLDLPDSVLDSLEFVVASVHSVLQMDREDMTRRLIRAVKHPAVTILGHPSGRLLLERESYPVDWDRLFDAAAEGETAIEFNAPDERLDLDWRLIRSATSRGVRICINPDAHSVGTLNCVATGIDVARKGWLTQKQVLNCLDLDGMKIFLAKSGS
jgi:DNA polymerase (family X)